MAIATRENFIPLIRDYQAFGVEASDEFKKGSDHGVRAVLSLITEGGFKLVDVEEDLVNPTHPDNSVGLPEVWDEYVNSINS